MSEERKPIIRLGHLFDYVSRRQYEFQLAWGVVGQFSALIAFETFAMVFCDKFGIKGTPSLLLYLVTPIVAVICVIWIGNQMIRTGYAHKYQKYGMDVNKDWQDTVGKVDEILKRLEKK